VNNQIGRSDILFPPFRPRPTEVETPDQLLNNEGTKVDAVEIVRGPIDAIVLTPERGDPRTGIGKSVWTAETTRAYASGKIRNGGLGEDLWDG
jgi:hypothetical protein